MLDIGPSRSYRLARRCSSILATDTEQKTTTHQDTSNEQQPPRTSAGVTADMSVDYVSQVHHHRRDQPRHRAAAPVSAAPLTATIKLPWSFWRRRWRRCRARSRSMP